MGLLDIINNGQLMNRQAELLVDIELDNGESRCKGDIVSVLVHKGNGKYHIENNDFSCTVSRDEFKFI